MTTTPPLTPLFNLANFTFTQFSDTVSPAPGQTQALYLLNASVDTLKGNDKIYARADYFLSGTPFRADAIIGFILGDADLRLGPDYSGFLSYLLGIEGDSDTIVAEAYSNFSGPNVSLLYGLDLEAGSRLYAGAGNDTVSGFAQYTNVGQSLLFQFGLSLQGVSLIDTGSGRDEVKGEILSDSNPSGILGQAGILLEGGSSIETGDGADRVTGIANVAGSSTSLLPITGIIGYQGVNRINTGGGRDEVTGRAFIDGQRANGFNAVDGQLVVDLGSGADKLVGYGLVTAFGGSGYDTWDLTGYSSTDFQINKTNLANRSASFSGFGAVADIEGFERFVFDDGVFSYSSLPVV